MARTAPIGRNARGRPGVGFLGCLVWLALLVALGYVGVQFGLPWSRYWRFKDAMRGQAEAAEVNTDVEIRQFLAETADRLEIPLAPRDLHVRRTRGEISVAASWSEEVVLPKFRRRLHFRPEVRAPLRPET